MYNERVIQRALLGDVNPGHGSGIRSQALSDLVKTHARSGALKPALSALAEMGGVLVGRSAKTGIRSGRPVPVGEADTESATAMIVPSMTSIATATAMSRSARLALPPAVAGTDDA